LYYCLHVRRGNGAHIRAALGSGDSAAQFPSQLTIPNGIAQIQQNGGGQLGGLPASTAPEPAPAALFAIGVAGLLCLRQGCTKSRTH
jgi:hypothetical protein